MYITSISPVNKNYNLNQYKNNTQMQDNQSFGIKRKGWKRKQLKLGLVATAAAAYSAQQLGTSSQKEQLPTEQVQTPVQSNKTKALSPKEVKDREEFENTLTANLPERMNDSSKKLYIQGFMKMYDIDPVSTKKIYNMTNSDGVLMRDTVNAADLLILSNSLRYKSAPRFERDNKQKNEETCRLLQQIVNLKDESTNKYIVPKLGKALCLMYYANGYNNGLIDILTMRDSAEDNLRFSEDLEYAPWLAEAAMFFEKQPKIAKEYAEAKYTETENDEDKGKTKYRFNLYGISLIGQSYDCRNNLDANHHSALPQKKLDTLLGLSRDDGSPIYSGRFIPDQYKNDYYWYEQSPEAFVKFYNQKSTETGKYINTAGIHVPQAGDITALKECDSVYDYLLGLKREDGSLIFDGFKPTQKDCELFSAYPKAFIYLYNQKSEKGEYWNPQTYRPSGFCLSVLNDDLIKNEEK